MGAPASVNYDLFAEIYDWDMAANIGQADLPVYRDYARLAGSVLELGCGTGRVLLGLIDIGCELWGLDNSEAMLARCRAKLEAAGQLDRLHLVQADMAEFDLPGRFDLIICAFGTFTKLLEREQQLGCLRRVGAHLAPGGRAVFDLFVQRYELLTEPDGVEHVDYVGRPIAVGGHLSRRKRIYKDPVNQVNRIELQYELVRDGRPEKFCLEDWLRWVSHSEMELLARLAGLRVTRVLGGYDGRPFDSGSDKMIFEMVKP